MTTYKSLYDIIKENNFSDKIFVNDSDAWVQNPDHQFIYNKLWVAQSQFIDCAPMKVYPRKYPIVFKPIINLIGMSRGFRKINNKEEYHKYLQDGLFWEDYLEGDHWCIDLVLNKGEILFCSCLLSHPGETGSFKYHESLPDFVLPDHIKYWIMSFFSDYIGCMNLEVIDDVIIEGHLRLNGDFHLYDTHFVSLISDLLEGKSVNFDSFKIKKMYLIPIFVEKNFSIKNTDFKNILFDNGIFHIFFDNIKSICQSEFLSRILIYSCEDLEFGMKIKDLIIKNYFSI